MFKPTLVPLVLLAEFCISATRDVADFSTSEMVFKTCIICANV